MKAVVCAKYGPPEVLRLATVDTPSPKNNELLLRVHATTVSSGDCRIRSFNVPPVFWIPGRLGLGITGPRKPILGASLGGEVETTGNDVTRFKKGDKVIAYTGHSLQGAYAEYCCIPEDGVLAIKPADMTYEEAAALPFGGISALYFLRQSNIQSGQQILIYGASGSVGTYAVQLAKYFGADVTGVCSSANAELVRTLGADRVIDYTKDDFTKEGKSYDIIFDTVGKTTLWQCRGSLKKEGLYLHTVMPLAGIARVWYSMTTGKKLVGGGPTPRSEDLVYLKELFEAKKLRPVIDRTYPLEQIVEAHRYVDTGRKKGDVVITVA